MANQFLPSDNDEIRDNNQSNVNERNHQEFQNLMEHSQKKYNDYWDINNPFIRLILIILFLVIVVGVAYYLVMWFRS